MNLLSFFKEGDTIQTSFYVRLRYLFFGIFILMLACWKNEIPEECHKNVSSVKNITFQGPNTIPDNSVAGYDVTITIEKVNDNESAIVCYLIRDQDPFWKPDDVLDVNIMFFKSDENTRTIEGAFALQDLDDEVYGTGVLRPEYSDCAGETEAEVYLQILTPDGLGDPKTPIKVIRIGN